MPPSEVSRVIPNLLLDSSLRESHRRRRVWVREGSRVGVGGECWPCPRKGRDWSGELKFERLRRTSPSTNLDLIHHTDIESIAGRRSDQDDPADHRSRTESLSRADWDCRKARTASWYHGLWQQAPSPARWLNSTRPSADVSSRATGLLTTGDWSVVLLPIVTTGRQAGGPWSRPRSASDRP